MLRILIITCLLLVGAYAKQGEDADRILKIYDQLFEVDSRLDVLEKATDSLKESVVQPEIIPLETVSPATSTDNTSLNIVWVVVAGVLVMLMQLGFALVESGLTRAKNAVHTLTMNLMDYGFGMLAFWAVGFAFMFGGVGAIDSLGIPADLLNSAFGFQTGDATATLIGTKGFFLGDELLNTGVSSLFFFQMVFAATANTICSGTLAERWRITAFCISSFFVAGVLYPTFGHWVWGGGWLSSVVGFSDFAGSVVVHGVGGIIALAGALVLGPRLGKYGNDGMINPIPGHNIPFVFIGTFILAFGWFGFNAGSSLAAGFDIGKIAVNTALASAAGSGVALLLTQIKFGKPDPTFACNGMLAGLVAITAGCAQVSTWAAVLIGAVGGFLVVFAALVIEEKLRIDDPVGAISVHGVCGLWGGIALGIFGNPSMGNPGLIYGGTSFFVSQIIGVLVCIAFVFPIALLMFKFIGFISPNRASDEEQSEGLDITEMGIEAYPSDV